MARTGPLPPHVVPLFLGPALLQSGVPPRSRRYGPTGLPSRLCCLPGLSTLRTLPPTPRWPRLPPPLFIGSLSLPGFLVLASTLCTAHRSLFVCDLVILVATPFDAALCSAVLPACRPVAASLADALRCSTSDPAAAGSVTVDRSGRAMAAVFCAPRPLDGADATCPHLCRLAQIPWLRSLLALVVNFPTQFGLFSLTVVIPDPRCYHGLW